MTPRGMLAAAAVLVASLAAAAPARADGIYFSESFGGTKINDELGAHVHDAVRIKLALGYRASRISFEGWIGADVSEDGDYSAIPENSSPSPLTYGMDLKYHFPISRYLEAYVRGSASRMEIDDGTLDGYGGRGLGIGTGLKIEGRIPLITMLYLPTALICVASDWCKRGKLGPMGSIALFVDQGYDFYRLHGPRGGGAIDADVTRWTIGIAIGSDF